MYVIKRSGKVEPVHFDKITARISKLCYGLNPDHVDPIIICQKVCAGVYKGVSTSELDELAAETAAYHTSNHPDYGILAARIAVSNLHKQTKKDWIKVCDDLHGYVEPKSGLPAPLLSDQVYAFIKANANELNSAIVYERDFNFCIFGFQTLKKSYLLKLNGKTCERPQHMLMRVSAGIHVGNVKDTIETYNLLSTKWFTHASPTLFNAGTPLPQMSSCFLLQIKDDSIEGIYDTLKQCAQISKHAGGIGLAVHKVRATGAYIAGTNGTSNGLTPMIRVFNNTARYVDQGGGKRKGAFAVYLEPWHADISEFLELKKNTGSEEMRARDLFYGLWTPDLFMRRVEANQDWSLFCPHEAPGLHECFGETFDELYERYEKEGRARKVVKARQLWQEIMESQIETGGPYMLFKDACNRKSNQQNLGCIQSSNLCTEIVQYTSPDEVAVCNLASVSLGMFVTADKQYDFATLKKVVMVMTRNLNKVIDRNANPIPEAGNSNMRHRPIGIGVQGLADAFMLLGLPFDSAGAAKLNREIFETMYFAALTASCELAKEFGPYSSYQSSPASKGILQFDMWNVVPSGVDGHCDWAFLRQEIAQHGLRNSLLLAPMPTASTSQILGNNESVEPFTSNLYVRRTAAGEFVCANKHLMLDLIKRGLWTPQMKNDLVANNGSVQGLRGIPRDMQELYKTVWEISGKVLIDMAADRGAYICQSQSFNVHMANATVGKLTSMFFYGWNKGLKTGSYYIRTQAAVDAIKFTVDQAALKLSKNEQAAVEKERKVACTKDDKDCVSCGS